MVESEVLVDRVVGPLTRTDFVRYAGAGGDFAPMHHDDEFARAIGYPSVFAHGLLTAGRTASVLSERFGTLALTSFGVRYVAQVWPGDRLRVMATRAAEQQDPALTELVVDVFRQGADEATQLVLKGTASVRGPETDA